MCTIGNSFFFGGNASFKQCDLKEKANFLEPQIMKGDNDIWYLPFRREKATSNSKPCWAGINNFGVSFVAADAYTNTNYPISEDDVKKLFDQYEMIISKSHGAIEGANSIEQFYMSGFPAPDIVHIADANRAIFMEYSPINHGLVGRVERTEGFFASANHFRMLPDAIEYTKDHSTYLRLNRAEAILQSCPNVRWIFRVLSDQYFGDTNLSICRVSQDKNQFSTQASVIFTTNNESIDCAYVLNGNPKNTAFSIWLDVFNPNSNPYVIKSNDDLEAFSLRYKQVKN